MQRKFIEFRNRLQEWADEDHREAGFSVETAIIVGALVAMALGLIALLWNLFNDHTQSLS